MQLAFYYSIGPNRPNPFATSAPHSPLLTPQASSFNTIYELVPEARAFCFRCIISIGENMYSTSRRGQTERGRENENVWKRSISNFMQIIKRECMIITYEPNSLFYRPILDPRAYKKGNRLMWHLSINFGIWVSHVCEKSWSKLQTSIKNSTQIYCDAAKDCNIRRTPELSIFEDTHALQKYPLLNIKI